MSTKQYAYFSAAILDGCKLRPQAFEPVSGFGSCAIEAGSEALTGEPRSDYLLIERMFPYMIKPSTCPEGCTEQWASPLSASVINACWHLNDTHKWSREAVADWLYEQEEKLGFVTLVETEAHKIPEAGRGDSVVTEAQAGVLTKRF